MIGLKKAKFAKLVNKITNGGKMERDVPSRWPHLLPFRGHPTPPPSLHFRSLARFRSPYACRDHSSQSNMHVSVGETRLGDHPTQEVVGKFTKDPDMRAITSQGLFYSLDFREHCGN